MEISIRDYLAGQALPACISKVETGLSNYERAMLTGKKRYDQLGGETQQELAAALAYSYADAMLKHAKAG